MKRPLLMRLRWVRRTPLGEPVVPVISVATTFHLPQAQGAAYFYGRSGQPTWDAVEAQLSILEAAEVVAFPSGMRRFRRH